MDLAKVKNLFFKTLIGCLVAAAILAVATVLTGSFNDVLGRALLTILIVAFYSLIGLTFIKSNEKQETFDSLAVFTNVTFGLIIAGFITAVAGTWGLVPGNVVGRLYLFYFVLLFATLHAEVLAKTLNKESLINNLVFVNYVFMFLVVLMLMPIIFLSDPNELGSFYYRLLAACGIIDATLTLITVILHNLYVQKHPKVVDPVFAYQQIPGQPGKMVQVVAEKPKKKMNIFVVLLLIYIGFQIVGSLLFMVFARIFYKY